MEMALSGATITVERRHGSNNNEGVLSKSLGAL